MGDNIETMRRLPKLIVLALPALAFVAFNVVIGVLASVGYDWAKDQTLVRKFEVPILVVLALFAVIYALWDARRGRETTEEPSEPAFRMRQRLVHRVLDFAQSQFDGGLYAKARKEFQLAERPLHVMTGDRALEVAIESYYHSLQEPLVILGEPGTGKTTLLYELAVLLCTEDQSDPIPVPFGLSNWALNEEPLDGWMVSELRRNYGVGSALAKFWINREVVLPFLDGLDEVPVAKRAACVTRINDYRAAHPGVRFAVTCREAEYGELKTGIETKSALVVRTLDRSDVEAFLESNVDKFTGLYRALDTERGLWELMNTPLMLWVGAFAFEEYGDLPTSAKAGQLRDHLFSRYVDRVLKRERGQDVPDRKELFSIPAAQLWLHRTAACMKRAEVFSFHLEDLSPIGCLRCSARQLIGESV